MAQEDDKNPDQSMEEILQSIKRIIADEDDDEAGADAAQTNETTNGEAADSDDVLELTEMLQPDGDISSAPEAEAIDDNDGFAAALPPAEAESPAPETPAEAAAEPAPAPAPTPVESPKPASDDSLLSADVAKASASMLSSLMQPADPETPAKTTTPSAAFRSGATVEDLVQEALRPMLKEWLDENLATLVERLVEKEVKRLSER